MTALPRRLLLLGLAAGAAMPALAQDGPEPQDVPIELVEEALELEAAIRVGSGGGDVTAIEFFDYNCPVCRRMAGDLPALLSDRDLTYVLMNFPILGMASTEAARVALAAFALEGPERALALHARLMGLRGVADGERALNAAIDLGLPAAALARAAESDAVAGRLRAALRVGESLGLHATPTTVIGTQALPGDIPLARRRALIARARA